MEFAGERPPHDACGRRLNADGPRKDTARR